MTNSSMASHDAVTLETAERRKQTEREDRAFVAQLRAAILSGLETPAGVLGHQHGPRKLQAEPGSKQADHAPRNRALRRVG